MTLEKFEASEGHTGEREKKADARKGERESGWNYFRSTATGFMHLHSLFSKAFLLVRISPNWPFLCSLSSASVSRHFFSGFDWVLRRSFYWPFLFNLAFATSRLMKQADWPSPALVRFLGHNSRQRSGEQLAGQGQR